MPPLLLAEKDSVEGKREVMNGSGVFVCLGVEVLTGKTWKVLN